MTDKKQKKSISSGDSVIATYLADLQNHPTLKHDDTVELFKQYEAGGKDGNRAKTKLIESNLRLVVSIAKRYKSSKIALEELIQEGNLGLIKAVERFKWEKGFRFSTYATWWITQGIQQFILKNKRIIRLPAHAAGVQKQIFAAREEFVKQFGTEPSQQELLDLVDASETVLNATIHSSREIVSLQDIAKSPGSSANEYTWEHKIPNLDPKNDPFALVSSEQLKEKTLSILKDLSPKESAILRLRFGLVEDQESQNDPGFELSPEELESIEKGNGLT